MPAGREPSLTATPPTARSSDQEALALSRKEAYAMPPEPSQSTCAKHPNGPRHPPRALRFKARQSPMRRCDPNSPNSRLPKARPHALIGGVRHEAECRISPQSSRPQAPSAGTGRGTTSVPLQIDLGDATTMRTTGQPPSLRPHALARGVVHESRCESSHEGPSPSFHGRVIEFPISFEDCL